MLWRARIQKVWTLEHPIWILCPMEYYDRQCYYLLFFFLYTSCVWNWNLKESQSTHLSLFYFYLCPTLSCVQRQGYPRFLSLYTYAHMWWCPMWPGCPNLFYSPLFGGPRPFFTYLHQGLNFETNQTRRGYCPNGCLLKMSRRTVWLRPSRFLLIERASILVGNWSFRNWNVYLRKLLKTLERIKFSHFTCDLTPPYWQTPKICEFAQLDWWLHHSNLHPVSGATASPFW